MHEAQIIQTEYETIVANPSHSLDEMYRLLSDYLYRVAKPILAEGGYVDDEDIHDLVEDCVVKILDEGIWSFESGEAMFSTWCAVVVKNRARDYNRRRFRLTFDSIDNDNSNVVNELVAGLTPEQFILEAERGLYVSDTLKKCIESMMNCKAKPYAIVASLYTLIIFHKYNPDSSELSSPKWAFDKLKNANVSQGASGFIAEMRSWMPEMLLIWSDSFIEACYSKIGRQRVGDLIFGDNFKIKDFENWSRRIREKAATAVAKNRDGGLEL